MNAYLVMTKDERGWEEVITDDGMGPIDPYWPMEAVVAETPGKAKSMFLKKYADNPRSGVYSDDYPNLRTRILAKETDYQPGIYEHDTYLWNLIGVSLERKPIER